MCIFIMVMLSCARATVLATIMQGSCPSWPSLAGMDYCGTDSPSFVGSVLAFDAHKRGLVSPNKARYERMKRQQKQ